MGDSDHEPYEVLWTVPARRALNLVQEKVAIAAVELIYGPLASNHRRVGHPLRFELEGSYSARPGDYRIVYRIEEERRRVHIAVIDHRADVYRRS